MKTVSTMYNRINTKGRRLSGKRINSVGSISPTTTSGWDQLGDAISTVTDDGRE